MAYATEEERAKFKADGWERNDDLMQFVRIKPGMVQFISAGWKGKKINDLSAPPPENVWWMAYAQHGKPPDIITQVVGQDAECQSPITCLVLAELREWKAP